MRARVALLLLALAAGRVAAEPRPAAPACGSGRFEIGETRGLPLAVPAAVELAGGVPSLAPDCVPLATAVTASRRLTRLRGRWSCPSLGGPVALRARIDVPECRVMRGRLRVGGRRGRFTATCTSDCRPAEVLTPPLGTGCRADLGATDCQAHQGDFERRGLSPEPRCHCRTEDAGAACRRDTDCQGMCLASADDAAPGTCSTYTVEFGCFTLLDEQGTRVTLCVD